MSPTHRVLFLDFDGCFHAASAEAPPADRTHFVWLPRLVDLRPRRRRPCRPLDMALTHEHAEIRTLLGPIGPQFLSTTPRGPRQESILWWLHMHPQITDYRVIDDDPREFDHEIAGNLILCPPLDGLRDAQVQARVREWLQACR